MHTEHLQNVHPGRALGGWLVAVAVTAVAVFVFIVLGLMTEEPVRDAVWAMGAVAVGFLVGGWFTGYRTMEAPILHGIALGLFSLVAWAGLNLLVAIPFGFDQWSGMSATATLVILLTQIVAAVAGCWIGTRGATARAEQLATTPETGVRERGID